MNLDTALALLLRHPAAALDVAERVKHLLQEANAEVAKWN